MVAQVPAPAQLLGHGGGGVGGHLLHIEGDVDVLVVGLALRTDNEPGGNVQGDGVAEVEALGDGEFFGNTNYQCFIDGSTVDGYLLGVLGGKAYVLVEGHLDGCLAEEDGLLLSQVGRKELRCIDIDDINLSIGVLAGCGNECHSCKRQYIKYLVQFHNSK